MSLKNPLLFGAALGAAGMLMACPPSRPQADGGFDSGYVCVGNCGNNGVDAGSDGGSQTTDGGSGSDGGLRTVSVGQARSATFCTDNIRIEGAVVIAVDNSFKGSQGDYSAQFWVADPGNPTHALYVDKFFTDTPGPYEPKPGDVLDIEGYLTSRSRYDDRVGYRLTLKSQFGCPQPNTGKLVITQRGTVVPLVDNVAPAGFGNSDGGAIQANREYAGARVHVPGPLTLTNPNPPALKRVSANANDDVHFGFEVSGGILVNNYKTFGVTIDGGTERCDWRAIANDGGAISFPAGIRGIWETYTHAPCYDGGTSSSCFRDAGHIPGTDQNYTYVLYPQDCAVDFANAVVQ